MKPEVLQKWFKEEVLPAIAKSGRLLEGEEIQSIQECQFETIEIGVCSFASTPSFAKLFLNTTKGLASREILVKFQNQNPIFREKMKLNLQFQNEVAMYNVVLPHFAEFLKGIGQNPDLIFELTPKCYLASQVEENPEKSVIVIEDLRGKGYVLSKSVTEMDLEHCLLALEKLAEFHAVSLAMKLRKQSQFDKLKSSFTKVWTADDQWTRNQCRDFKGLSSQRGIEYLMSKTPSEVPLTYLENLKKMLNPTGLFDLLATLSSPKEPLSVICHGDFNRNNILYRYSGGKVADAKLIDFQTFLYGPPGLDLSFFIYMNTTLDFREKHFDDIFKHYHSSLVKRMALILRESEKCIEDLFPLEAFREDFARVAITGYVTASFFLPVMMAPRDTDIEEDLEEKEYKELAEENYVQGGEIVSRRIAEIIVDFYRRGFYR